VRGASSRVTRSRCSRVDGDRLLGGDLDRECGPSAWVNYHVRCTRVAEIVGLLALHARREDKARAAEIADWLVRFAQAQPGAAI
jgi:hypothetical protein